VSDRLGDLLEQRSALIRRFADDMLALDLQIGEAQRHNVQSQTAAMLTTPYAALDERVSALEALMRPEHPA